MRPDRASSQLTYTQLGVEFGSKLIEIPEQGKIVKLQCQFPPSARRQLTSDAFRLGYGRDRILSLDHALILPWCCGVSARL